MGVPRNPPRPPNEPMPPARKLTTGEKKRIAADAGWRCYACDLLLPSTYEIDHKIPLCEGGADTPENCGPLCPDCHRRKTEEETIRRARRNAGCKRSSELECKRCGAVVSRFFLHRCSTPRQAEGASPAPHQNTGERDIGFFVAHTQRG